MNEKTPHWDRISLLFGEAIELPHEQWKHFLDKECSVIEKEQGVYTKVLQLLKASNKAESFFNRLEENIGSELDKNNNHELYHPGDEFGKFKIIRQIGYGGMSWVYLCERNDGQFEQKVAIKVMKVQNNLDFFKEKFRQEQQILAGINHPNIAQLYDGGITAEGFPFMIMEYVEGEAIDEYCQTRKLGVKEVLKLFVQVSNALQYAHNKLIVHHDIKPANILVNKDGLVKLLDFGISHIIHNQEYGNKGNSAFSGTLQYASPEQFEGAGPSVASDIYKLGLVLFYVLTGEHYNFKQFKVFNGGAYSQLKKFLSNNKHFSQKSNLIQKDLTAIFLKALASSPEDRFVTVSALTHDLQNAISNQPLHSHKASLGYTLHKGYVRNKTSAWLFAGFNVALLVVIWFFVAQYFETIRAKERAEQILQFVWEIFDSVDPEQVRGETLTALDLFEKSKERIEGLEDQPLLQSELFLLTGQLVGNLGDWEQAGQLFYQSLEKLPEKNDQHHQLLKANILRHISAHYFDMSNYPKADSVIDNVLFLYKNTGRKGQKILPEIMVEKANILRHLGEYQQAVNKVEQSISIYRSDKSYPPDELAKALNVKASCLREMGQFETALITQSEAFEIMKKEKEHNLELFLSTLNNLAILQQRNGLYDQALATNKQARAMYVEIYGYDNPNTIRALSNMGVVYHRMDQRAKADSIYNRVYRLFEDLLGPTHQYTVSSLFNLANSLYEQGNYQEVLPLYYKVLEGDINSLGENHPLVAMDYIQLGNVFMELEKWEKAEYNLRNGESILKENFGNEHSSISRVYFSLGELYGRQSKPKPCINYLEKAVALAKEHFGEKHSNTKRYQETLAAYKETFSVQTVELLQ